VAAVSWTFHGWHHSLASERLLHGLAWCLGCVATATRSPIVYHWMGARMAGPNAQAPLESYHDSCFHRSRLPLSAPIVAGAQTFACERQRQFEGVLAAVSHRLFQPCACQSQVLPVTGAQSLQLHLGTCPVVQLKCPAVVQLKGPRPSLLEVCSSEAPMPPRYAEPAQTERGCVSQP